MKLASVQVEMTWRIGLVDDVQSTVAVLSAPAGTVDDVVRGGPEALVTARAARAGASVIPLQDAVLGSPLRRFNRDILCTGWNYWDHFEESRGRREGQDPDGRPKHPAFFTKGPDTVIGPYDDIAFDPQISQKWDYEAEVAIIIGKDGRSIPAEQALDHVLGYCVANDVSQRDLQRAHGGQWLKGKSIDSTMPMGPWITTADEVEDPYAIRLQCEVNGVTMQDASTKQMAFTFDQIIAELSWGMTLRAGDVVLTGTPAGIGNARTPPVYLGAGDDVTTRASGLGELRNRVVRRDLN